MLFYMKLDNAGPGQNVVYTIYVVFFSFLHTYCYSSDTKQTSRYIRTKHIELYMFRVCKYVWCSIMLTQLISF